MKYFPGVDLVVVNYKTPQDLRGFLKSYVDLDAAFPHTLTVVNVQPTAADLQVVEDLSREIRFLHITHKDNVGYARACNHASMYPDREVVAFFNADTRLMPGVIEDCAELLMSNHNYAIAGPRQVDDNNKITHAGIFGTQEDPSLRGWQEWDSLQYADIRDDAVSVAGSAYFVKRQAWDHLASCPRFLDCPEVKAKKPMGAFLPTQHYYEETYCSYHAHAHDYQVVYNGAVVMTHRWHKASKVGSKEAEGQWKDSQNLFRAACEYHAISHN